jgi:hypothetical protein
MISTNHHFSELRLGEPNFPPASNKEMPWTFNPLKRKTELAVLDERLRINQVGFEDAMRPPHN